MQPGRTIRSMADKNLQSIGAMRDAAQYSAAFDVLDKIFRSSGSKRAENQAIVVPSHASTCALTLGILITRNSCFRQDILCRAI
jgi:hypothetical protein